MPKLNIAIVDDNHINFEMINMVIDDIADTAFFSSGLAAIAGVPELSPDIVLLDVDMPGIDGYQVCQKLKSQRISKHIPIIFVSAHGDLDSKIKGYHAGAEDYITKPINDEELRSKIRTLSDYKIKHEQYNQKIEELEQQVSDAADKADSAIATMSDMGQILAFMEAIHFCCEYDEVGKLVIRNLKAYNILANLEITVYERVYDITHDDIIVPLEADILRCTASKGKIYSVHDILTIHHEHIALFIPSIPHKDEAQLERIKNFAIQLTSIANDRIKTLITIKLLQDQCKDIVELAKDLKFIESDEGQLESSIHNVREVTEKLKTTEELSDSGAEDIETQLNRVNLNFEKHFELINRIDRRIGHLADHEQKIISLLSNSSCRNTPPL